MWAEGCTLLTHRDPLVLSDGYVCHLVQRRSDWDLNGLDYVIAAHRPGIYTRVDSKVLLADAPVLCRG